MSFASGWVLWLRTTTPAWLPAGVQPALESDPTRPACACAPARDTIVALLPCRTTSGPLTGQQ